MLLLQRPHFSSPWIPSARHRWSIWCLAGTTCPPRGSRHPFPFSQSLLDFIGVWEDYVITDLGRACPLVLPQALSASLLEEISLILLCLYTPYSLLRLDTLYLNLLTCTLLPLQETIMSHTNIPYYSLYLDLLTSAAPKGDYVTPMNNTHLSSVVLSTLTDMIFVKTFMRPKFLSWFRGRDKIDHPLSLHLIHTLCLDLLTSAAPGSGYDMPMNNTHVLCLVPSYLYICPIKAPRGKDKIDPTLFFLHTLYP